MPAKPLANLLAPLTQAQQDQLQKEQQLLQLQLKQQKALAAASSGTASVDAGGAGAVASGSATSSTTISLSTVVPVPVRTGAPGVAPSQIVLGKVLPPGSGTNSKSGPGGRRQAPAGNKNYCMKFLSGMCFDQGCPLRHATSAEELAEGRSKFDRPCAFGHKCFRVGCLYNHQF